MAKVRFTISIDDSTLEMITSYKEKHGLDSTSQAIEELINIGNDSIQAQPNTVKGCVYKLFQLSDHMKELVKAKP